MTLKEEHKLHSCREFKKYGSSYKRFAPGKALKEYVSYFFVSECAENKGMPFSLKLVPDGCAELYWHRCEKFEYEISKCSKKSSSNFFLAGPAKNISLIKASLPVLIIGANFKPSGFYPFASSELKNYINSTTPASEIWGDEADMLSGKIENSSSGSEAVGHIEKFLESQFLKNEKSLDMPSNDFITEVVNSVIKHKGNLSVFDISNEFGLCERQIERKFKTHIGMSPKLFVRIIRFKSCLDELLKNKDDSTLAILHSCGYYDQAHFIKEFKHFSDLLPGEYLQWMKKLGLR